MKNLMRSLACLLFCALAQAQGVPPSAAETEPADRARIETRRQQEVARFAQEEQACTSRFTVNECLQSVRTRKREVLADLRRQEISLNDAKRRRQGALELQRTESKLRDSTVADSPAANVSATERLARKTQDKSQTQSQRDADAQARSGEQAQKKKQFADQQAQRDAKAGLAVKNQRQHEEKLSEAAQHKAELLERQKKQTHPGAKPLPEHP